jgi:hypothetical protein
MVVVPMTAVFVMAISLIVALPALTIAGGIFWEGLILAVAAMAMALTALMLRAGESRRLAQYLKLIVPFLFLPCIWMLIQIAPAPIHGLAHPAWASAAAALNQPILGAISLDIGLTALCLARYCLVLAIAIIVTALALDRRRTKIIFFLLAATSALIAVISLVSYLGYMQFANLQVPARRAQMLDIAVIGIILSCAIALRGYETYEQRRIKNEKPETFSIFMIAAPVIACVICLFAIMADGNAGLLLAAACGAGTLASAAAIRHLRLGPWGKTGIAVAAIIGLIGFFTIHPMNKGVDVSLALANEPHNLIATTLRMAADAKWTGTGAGTFSALRPIYRDAENTYVDYTAPTAASQIMIEMGQPFLWGLVIFALVGAWILFQRALSRGRDYLYAGSGAACIVALIILLFVNSGALGLSSSLLAGMICGMALGQSKRASTSDLAPVRGKQATVTSALIQKKEMPGEEPALAWLRYGLLAFGVVLAMQAAWIILAEYYHPGLIKLPVDRQTSLVLLPEQDRIKRAASLATIRGDLWAESAFTNSNLLWKESPTQDGSKEEIKQVQKELIRALQYSPHRGDVWLMMAAMEDRYSWPTHQPGSLLKMSYYTAPNEQSLFPLRLRTALRPSALQDVEVQDMAQRDIRMAMGKAPALKPALLAAYKDASPQGRSFVDRVVSEIDPTYLAALRAGLR